MTKRNTTPSRTADDRGIRELTVLEAQAVSGAVSVRPDQLSEIASVFGSAGGSTATSGLIMNPKLPKF